MQTPRLRLPVLGDLRRDRLHLRLRPLRGPAEDQREERVVALDAAGTRRHRRPRLGDHPEPQGLGSVRPPRRVHRPAGPVPRQVQAALAGGPPARGRGGRRRRPRRRDQVPRVRRRPERAAQLQPDVRDARRPGRGRGLGGLPPPGDGAGHLHQLQERARLRPQEAAVRDRPGRQVLPQRDHPRQLHLPHPRVRADGDGVLRPARRSRPLVPRVDRDPRALVHRPRPASRPPADPPARPGRALALLVGDERRRVPLPDRLVGARGDRQPRRLRPQSPHRGAPARSSSTSTSRPKSATCRT